MTLPDGIQIWMNEMRNSSRSYQKILKSIDSMEMLVIRRRHNAVEVHCVVSWQKYIPKHLASLYAAV